MRANKTLAEIDDALKEAWATHRRQAFLGNLDNAARALVYVDELLDRRSFFAAVIAA